MKARLPLSLLCALPALALAVLPTSRAVEMNLSAGVNYTGSNFTGYVDTNKQFTNKDSLMCWACTASNMIEWWQLRYQKTVDNYHNFTHIGYGNYYDSSTGQYYNYATDVFANGFIPGWTNFGQNIIPGLTWYFTGETEHNLNTQSNASVCRGGGGFLKKEANVSNGTEFLQRYTERKVLGADTDMVGFLRRSFDGGAAVLGLQIVTRTATASSFHAITCWGYGVDEQGQLELYLSDSDDCGSNPYSKEMIRAGLSYKDNQWTLDSRYTQAVGNSSVCTIDQAVALLSYDAANKTAEPADSNVLIWKGDSQNIFNATWSSDGNFWQEQGGSEICANDGNAQKLVFNDSNENRYTAYTVQLNAAQSVDEMEVDNWTNRYLFQGTDEAAINARLLHKTGGQNLVLDNVRVTLSGGIEGKGGGAIVCQNGASILLHNAEDTQVDAELRDAKLIHRGDKKLTLAHADSNFKSLSNENGLLQILQHSSVELEDLVLGDGSTTSVYKGNAISEAEEGDIRIVAGSLSIGQGARLNADLDLRQSELTISSSLTMGSSVTLGNGGDANKLSASSLQSVLGLSAGESLVLFSSVDEFFYGTGDVLKQAAEGYSAAASDFFSNISNTDYLLSYNQQTLSLSRTGNATPEPATATLSLLALTLLAARRRRR